MASVPRMGSCQKCGVQAELAEVTILQCIGLIVGLTWRMPRGFFCKRCIDSQLATATAITAILGWWSIVSVFLTPIFLVLNAVTFARTRSLRDAPPAPAMLAPSPRFDVAPPVGGARPASWGGAPPAPAIPSKPSLVGPAIAGLAGLAGLGIGGLLAAFFAYQVAFPTDSRDVEFGSFFTIASLVVCCGPSVLAIAFAIWRVRRVG